MAAPGHGGRRPGAGRPPTYTEPMVRKTVLVPASYLPLLEREGNGNLSEGVRFVLEQARTPGGGYWFNPRPPRDRTRATTAMRKEVLPTAAPPRPARPPGGAATKPRPSSPWGWTGISLPQWSYM